MADVRPVARWYALLTVGAAGLLAVVDVTAVPAWPYTWTLLTGLVLLASYALAVHFQFRVHSSYATDASTVPAVATALLLPPGVGVIVAGVAMLIYALSHRELGLKSVFNIASAMLAIGAAAHLATSLGGPGTLTSGSIWTALPVAVLASMAYYLVSVATIAGAVALDQGRPLWAVLRDKLGSPALAEMALGLLGSTLAVVLTAAPGLSPALIVPAVLVYLAERSMDRGERRSRDMALMSRVGRAVASTLRPEIAFRAITSREVRDALKLDGIVLVPLGRFPTFARHPDGEMDQLALREAVARQVEAEGQRIVMRVRTGQGSIPTWLPAGLASIDVSIAALPFGSVASNPVGALLAWRPGTNAERACVFTTEELVVLETLADYAAVALETSRLANEMARLSHEAAEKQIALLAERERTLAGLSAGLMRAQEEERRRLALELHDDPLQRVNLLARRLADRGLDVEFEAAEDVALALRAVCYGLRPPMLDDLGLPAALDRLVSDVAAASDVRVVLELTGAPPVGRPHPDLELALYRVAQEALNNVLKHAHAQHATLTLAFTGDLVELQIEDDGRGTTTGYSNAMSLGVVGMRERLKPWAGHLSIGPRVGGGTTVVAQARLSPPDAGRRPAPGQLDDTEVLRHFGHQYN